MKKDKLYDSKGNEKYLIQTPLHEFSHGYINPLTDEYKLATEKNTPF